MKNSLDLQETAHPRWVITWFVAKRTLSGAILWGLLFGFVTFTSAYGFITAFTTQQARNGLIVSFGGNVGLKALLGLPHAINTIAGFTEWRALGVVMLIGAIWGMMLSTKLLRGDEEDGRLELLLAGETNMQNATAQALAGMGIGLILFFAIIASIVVSTGHLAKIQFATGPSLLLALTMTISAALFMAVGAVTSQIAGTKRQALTLAAGVFGISFMLRALADASNSQPWLRSISPLGWLEQLQPLTGIHPLWFIPLGITIMALVILSIFLAGKRDLGEGFLKEKAAPRSHFSFLSSVWGLAFRLTEGSILGWTIVMAVISLLFGGVAKSAAQALLASQTVDSYLTKLNTNLSTGASTFLGLIFMIFSLLLMVMVAGSVSSLREEEASSHLDNLLVRSTSRSTWLASRLFSILIALTLTGTVIGLVTWSAIRTQNLDISLHTLLQAGINTAFPALFLLGIGTLIFGLLPRLASTLSYGYIAIAFLIQFVASALNVPNWVLDLSVLHHMALAPAVAPDWHANSIMALLALVMALIGGLCFNRRDVAVE